GGALRGTARRRLRRHGGPRDGRSGDGDHQAGARRADRFDRDDHARASARGRSSSRQHRGQGAASSGRAGVIVEGPKMRRASCAIAFLGLFQVDSFAEERADKSGYNLWRPVPDSLLREMATDRPDKTESAFTVDAGHYQIEMDVLSYRH